MGDIFVSLAQARQAPWRCLAAPCQVSRVAASPTGILPVRVATVLGSMAVTKAPEALVDFRMLTDAARTHPILTLPRCRRRVASASASRITAVFTPPKRVKSLQGPSSTCLPSDKHKTDTTSSFLTVSSRSLISRDLVETRGAEDAANSLSTLIVSLKTSLNVYFVFT